MAEKNDKLIAALKQAKTTPMFFAFVAVGATDGVLIVAKKSIPIKEINEAKAESGGKKVMRGRVQVEDGKFVFECAEEPGTNLAKALKAVIHRDAAMTVQVETRMAPDLQTEGEETEVQETPTSTPPPPPPPPSNDGANRFAARLKALAPALEKITAAGHAKAPDVKQKFTDANAAFRQHQFDQANALLDQAEALIKEALAGIAPKAPPPPPPPTQRAPAPTRDVPVSPEVVGRVQEAIKSWQTACETLDGQVTQLQKVLIADGDEELAAIAEFGLNGITGNHRVKLQAAVLELRSAGVGTLNRLATRALPTVLALNNHISTSEEIAACDTNPFNVTVTIRALMGPPLTELEAALRAATQAL